MENVLSGIAPIAPTPFHKNSSVDLEGMRRVLDCMIDQGVVAICILANYSEQFLLSDAGATGTMTSAMFPEKIRPIVSNYRSGNIDVALTQWNSCLPLINHENRQCGLRACKTVFKEGGVIASDRIRHPLRPLSARTRERLISLARDLDIIALKWGH